MMTGRKRRKGFLLSKKGNLAIELIWVFVFLVIFGLSTLTLTKIQVDLNDDMHNDTSMTNESIAIMQDNTEKMPGLFDAMFVTLFVFLWGMLLVSSFMIDNHPIFFAFMLILVIVAGLLPAIMANAVDEVMSDVEFVGIFDLYPMTYWIISHLFQVYIVVAFSVMITLFAKSKT